jgi:hypothetical protein
LHGPPNYLPLDGARRLPVSSPQKQLTAQVNRREELAGVSGSIEDFCQRIRQGLEQALLNKNGSWWNY